jgi:AcrR family transcriptional regulator
MDGDRSFVSNARRARIVEAAIATLAESVTRTPRSRVSRYGSASQGVISYHFAGKDDLIAEIVSQDL